MAERTGKQHGRKPPKAKAPTKRRRAGGRPFQKGQSGNPAGRPVGALNKSTRVALSLFEGEAEAIGRKAVELAKAGDIQAIRLIVERLCPPARERSIRFDLPEIGKIEDMPAALGRLVKAVSSGEVLPSEAERLASLFAVWCQALQDGELLRRVEEIEKARQREREC